MEISLREWLVVGGVIVIALIIFDGWRRVRGGRNSLRMDIDRKLRDLPEEPVEPSSNPELPYGGARPISGQVPEFVPKRKPGAAYAAKMAATAKAADESATEPAERIEPTFGFSAESRQQGQPRVAEPARASAPESSALEPQARGASDFRAPLRAGTEADGQAGTESRVEQRIEPDSDAQSAVQPPAARPSVEHASANQVAVNQAAVPPAAAPRAESHVSFDADPLFDEPTEEDYPAPRRASFAALEPEADDSHAASADAKLPEAADAKSAAGSGRNYPQSAVQKPAEEVPQHVSRGFSPEMGETDPLFDDLPVAPALDLEKPIPLLMERNRQPKRASASAESAAGSSSSKAPAAPQQDLLFGNAPEQPEPAGSRGRAAEPAAPQARTGDSSAAAPNPDSVLVITVVSSVPEGLPGALLYKIISACDLHFGDMDIFHRHEDGSDTGPVQFSMANAVNPGTFDLATIDEMTTQAVTFFMSMREPRDVMNAFECMLATAETLARHLDGDLLDENRSVLRPQTKEHYRQRIRDFEMHNRSRRGGSRV
ncbi:cell division protein ZipA [Marinobacterium aestuarii]|uniref:Cell division protein ZipA n=1 Tax=Marinobacterium aestuarii TaxID=1821621 RepID=A0A1A9EVB4_9GAMM|nr:cell division protein ZipA [Marinobacterium aestuarii]ANG61777.1 cell division protein ZipA [Marinobacterium aestuarii]